MAIDDRTKIVPKRTPESAAMLASVKRAMAITANLNRLTCNDADEVRTLFSDLIGKKVDDSFLLIPPFYTAGGVEISVGRNVFVNQNCTFYDLGGLHIADNVMIGPNVSIITWRHPVVEAPQKEERGHLQCGRERQEIQPRHLAPHRVERKPKGAHRPR